jgi:hypothetical protein
MTLLKSQSICHLTKFIKFNKRKILQIQLCINKNHNNCNVSNEVKPKN